MILLRTAGNDYREKLMNGDASYTDPEVVRAFGLWNDLVQAGYFYPDANAYGYIDSANMVANGEAAMTLMGTWIGGHFASVELTPGEDFDYFSFPTIDEDTPRASLGPIDTFVVSADAANPDAAKAFLVHLTNPDVQWAFAEGRWQPGAELDGGHEQLQRCCGAYRRRDLRERGLCFQLRFGDTATGGRGRLERLCRVHGESGRL